ncbi:hypothetical protein TcG_01149 [Trypanosoma cruzi]|nr:hypothetical protein TcBrA4_0086080 [Trypanosoma cruzi]RNF24051.1 hypothetical protein TcG_01149 [Trypanosoma cruzi]
MMGCVHFCTGPCTRRARWQILPSRWLGRSSEHDFLVASFAGYLGKKRLGAAWRQWAPTEAGRIVFCGVTATRTEALVLEKRVAERARVCRANISDCGSGGCNVHFSQRVVWSFFTIGGVERGACFVFAQHASSLQGRMVAEVEVATARLFCATAIFCTHLTAHLFFLEAVRRRTLASS